jgi:hypothetical protein
MLMQIVHERKWLAGVIVALLGGLAQAAPAPQQAARAEPDKLAPADAEAIVTINVRQLVQAPLVQKRALPQLRSALEHNTGVKQLLKAMEIDPLTDIERITISVSGTPGKGGHLATIIRGSFKPEKIRAAAAQQGDRVTSSREGDVTVYEIKADKPVYAALIGSKVLVATLSKSETVAVVESASKAPAPRGADMQAALAQLKGTESIWVAMLVTKSLKEAMKGDQAAQDFAESLRYLVGKVEVKDDAQGSFTIHTADADAAKQLYQKLDELTQVLPFLAAGKDPSAQIGKSVIDTLKISQDKTDVHIRFHLSDDMIEKAVGQQPKK